MKIAPTPRVPSVEDRLTEAKRAIALAALLSHGLARPDDTCLTSDMEADAYTLLSDLCIEAWSALQATAAALDNGALITLAPHQENGEAA